MSDGLAVRDCARRLKAYVRRQNRRVSGWFNRADGEIFMSVLLDQKDRGVPGSALEIGVHHGRSFIPLSLASSASAPAIAVDIFDDQRHNTIDPSGRGDYKTFVGNLKRFGIADCAKIIVSSSLELSPQSIGREIRFASIDGGHWHDAVLNDLRLVEACAGPDCVIALDDMFNPDYAEVMVACFEWLQAQPSFHAFALTDGKIYFCRPGHEVHYKQVLLGNFYLLFNNKKSINFHGSNALIITGLYGGLLSPIKRYIQIKSPQTYTYMRAFAKRRGPETSSRIESQP
jgi:Methyltransferase domain